MTTPTYPGVYIEELPSNVHTIVGVATSITAFVGRAAQGPVNVQTVINSWGDYNRIFGGLWMGSTMSFAVNDFFLNGGGQAVIVRLANGGTASQIVLGEDQASPPFSSANALILQAASVGSWGSGLTAAVDHNTKDASSVNPVLFNLTLQQWDATGTQLLATEKHQNLSVDPTNSRYVANWLAQNSNLAVVAQDAGGNYEVPPLRPAATNPTAPVTASPGSDGNLLTSLDFIGPGTSDNKLGLYALENTDLFNLLCIPPYTSTPTGQQVDVDLDVVTAAATYCELRRAFYIIDSPSTWTTKTIAVTQFTNTTDQVGTRSDHAALFFPRVNEQNPLQDNQLQTFAACGVVAGVFAYTDAQRHVWKAPAGQSAQLANVVSLSVPLTDAENGELNPLGVNCLRAFPIIGRVVWGSRTLQGADQLESQWKYIPVRRTALFIEESLYRGTKWAVFEPNDERLWAQLRLSVGSFMHDQFLAGAFQGTSARAAYFVKCDDETTTQNDIDLGIVNIVVGFAPLLPAEFVIIQIQQMAGQVQT